MKTGAQQPIRGKATPQGKSSEAARAVKEDVWDSIAKALERGGPVRLVGFGTFTVTPDKRVQFDTRAEREFTQPPISDFIPIVDESKPPDYTGRTMGDAPHDLNVLAAGLGYTFESAKETLERGAAEAARGITSRSAKAPQRLKWDTDRRLPDENPATFAWRAYQAEAKAGTLHRGLIATEDRPLHRKLKNWLRTHDMPEGIDIPTLPEWNDRQVEKLAILRDDATAREVMRLAAVATRRRARERMPGM